MLIVCKGVDMMSNNLRTELLNLLGEERKVLRNEIPKNVNSSYKVFLDLNMKELLVVFLPPLIFMIISGFVMYFINALNMYTIFLVILIALILWFTLYGLLTIRPVSEKNNLRMLDFFRMSQRYSTRQKVFFYKRKNENATISKEDING